MSNVFDFSSHPRMIARKLTCKIRSAQDHATLDALADEIDAQQKKFGDADLQALDSEVARKRREFNARNGGGAAA